MNAPALTYQVQFEEERAPRAELAGRVLRVAHLLALAHRIDGMIRAGEIEDLATAAPLCGLTRARITQVMNLTLLAPTIQEAILDQLRITAGRDPTTERNLRAIVAEPEWTHQIAMWGRMNREER